MPAQRHRARSPAREVAIVSGRAAQPANVERSESPRVGRPRVVGVSHLESAAKRLGDFSDQWLVDEAWKASGELSPDAPGSPVQLRLGERGGWKDAGDTCRAGVGHNPRPDKITARPGGRVLDAVQVVAADPTTDQTPASEIDDASPSEGASSTSGSPQSSSSRHHTPNSSSTCEPERPPMWSSTSSADLSAGSSFESPGISRRAPMAGLSQERLDIRYTFRVLCIACLAKRQARDPWLLAEPVALLTDPGPRMSTDSAQPAVG